MDYNYVIECIPIYKAAIEGDWETAKRIFKKEKKDLNASITCWGETTLHIAVGTNSSHRFVEQLVEQMMQIDPQMLLTGNCYGSIPLQYAAKVGNIQAVRLLVSLNPEMTQINNNIGETALKLAAMHAERETLLYLLETTKDVVGEDGTSPYRGAHGADLLSFSISADFYDVALYLVNKYPDIVPETNIINSHTSLQVLAAKHTAFQSGSGFGFWQRFIYSWIPVNREKALKSLIGGKSEVFSTQNGTRASSGLNISFWSVLQYLAPHIKRIHDSKVKNVRAEELVKHMCSAVIRKVDHATAWDVLGTAIATAVKHGIHELIQECIHQYPGIIWYDIDGFYLFSFAIRHRSEKVYNLVYQMSGHKAYVVAESRDGENSLHYAGKLAPPHRLNTVTGAALQMQRELQWFKEVEKLVKPSHREALNNENHTPRMVFSDEHKELLKDAQQWMISTASSATVVAALIVTMAFAAIFTAPGGNDDSGKPLFLRDPVFTLFVSSDAVALFSSSTSVLVFLSVLSSRFAEEDFLYALPKRLTLGLISLFVSIAATMVAFSAALSLVIRDEIHWIAAPVILLAVVPVTLFLLLQYPLLVELVRSTYGCGIFYKQNNLLLH
ncbi:uncharacterized protein LOC108226682 [Daucus carota subsp. sativus]|uniref:uncharacterized protein LOC108226682 n=1 Tax=Daucus carota subsp. sativus TaxID=79200 RepID=UPI0007EFFA03|nr:PREDICTED: uncharacterized protein LOC108226682 [Daucus carota subsp. sativus]